MDLLDFAQKHYFNEIDRRNQITGSLSIPVSILVVLIGALVYFASNYRYEADVLSYLFAILVLAALILVGFAIVYLFKSYWSYVYQYLPSLDEMRDYHTNLVNYYRQVSPKRAQKSALSDFEDDLYQKYSQAATINARNNNQKSANLHNANTCLVWLIVALSIATPVFYWQQYNTNSHSSPQIIEVNMSGKDSSDKGKEQKPATPKPQKPQSPPNVNLREGDEGKNKGGKKLNE